MTYLASREAHGAPRAPREHMLKIGWFVSSIKNETTEKETDAFLNQI